MNQADRDEGIKRLQATGLTKTEASRLFGSAIAGAEDAAAERITGESTVPSNMTDARAAELHHICIAMKRLVSERETGVLFRIPESQARSVLQRMKATYEDSLRSLFLDHMRASAAVERSGSKEEGLSWTVRFTEASAYDIARTELQRLGLVIDAQMSPTKKVIVLPRQVAGAQGDVDPLKELGLPSPKAKS